MQFNRKSPGNYDSLENRERYLFAQLFDLNSERLMEQVRKLKPRVRRALEMRFGLNDGVLRTYDQIGEVLGVTRERVRQLVVQGMHALRRWQRARSYSNADYHWYLPKELEDHIKKYKDFE